MSGNARNTAAATIATSTFLITSPGRNTAPVVMASCADIPRRAPITAMAGSLVFTHPIGIAVMGGRLGMSAQEAITTGAVFLPGDVIKNVLVAIVAAAVFRAFPDMLERR